MWTRWGPATPGLTGVWFDPRGRGRMAHQRASPTIARLSDLPALALQR